jgi:DNA-binding response OmpR family regulator
VSWELGLLLKGTILLIEGSKNSIYPQFYKGLVGKGFQVEKSASGSSALGKLTEMTPDVVVVNAASMGSSGKRICQAIRAQSPKLPIILIKAVNDIEENGDVNASLILPFTLQKLVNRIKPLLPVEQKMLMTVGEIELDEVHRLVRVNGKQAQLTPQLVILLRTLMLRPNEVIEREALFKEVWDTAYTADTRTLDVHISWLRQAVEADGRHPRYIKTVRGVGYRLDVEGVSRPRRHSDRRGESAGTQRPTQPTMK